MDNVDAALLRRVTLEWWAVASGLLAGVALLTMPRIWRGTSGFWLGAAVAFLAVALYCGQVLVPELLG